MWGSYFHSYMQDSVVDTVQHTLLTQMLLFSFNTNSKTKTKQRVKMTELERSQLQLQFIH